EPDVPRAGEVAVEVVEGGAHLQGGAGGADDVVLVEDGHAEDGHDGVADELLDGPAVALDDAAHLGEVAGHHELEGLGVQAVSERGEAADVGEHDGDGLTGVEVIDGGAGQG